MTGRFWHEIEGRPWPEVQAIQETRLRHQLAYLEGNSEFYRAKLKAAGVAFDQIRTTADLVRDRNPKWRGDDVVAAPSPTPPIFPLTAPAAARATASSTANGWAKQAKA